MAIFSRPTTGHISDIYCSYLEFLIHQSETSELPKLRSAIERTCLNDRSVSVALESSLAMGSGWRLGFLGVLHMEVFQQRMSQEFDAEVIVTAPTVPYKITVLTCVIVT